MKLYSEEKFKELSIERKLTLMLSLIGALEKDWSIGDKKESGIRQLRNYFFWCELDRSDDIYVSKLAPLKSRIREDLSLRDLLDIAVPIERCLEVSVKDDQIFSVSSIDKEFGPRKTQPLCLILDHLRSAFNVGSVFRTAECLGVEHLFLVGYTPTPDDRGVAKTAMGAQSMVPWSSHNHLSEVISLLKQREYQIAALETADHSISLFDYIAPQPLALLFGNERFGLQDGALRDTDCCLTIPMMGQKNSMNVANAVSVAAFEVTRQWRLRA